MKYICSWSGGKDSTASVILAHENNEPLDLIVFSEVMFDENISGELPEQVAFIEKAKKVFESWGYEVKILHSNKTYMDCFMDVQKYSIGNKHPERVGKHRGFPMAMRCKINCECKVAPIKKFFKDFDEEYTQYIGIAVDEPRRLERLRGTNKISLLEKYGYTEEMAKELCRKYDLLSPVYEFTKRGGCWFCPNMRNAERERLFLEHRDLWDRLVALEDVPNKVGDIWNTLTKESLKDMDKKFKEKYKEE